MVERQFADKEDWDFFSAEEMSPAPNDDGADSYDTCSIIVVISDGRWHR